MSARRTSLAPAAIATLTALFVCTTGCGSSAAAEPHITVSEPAVGAVPGDSAAVYLRLENSGADDALTGATCDCDGTISLHVTEDMNGVSIMSGADQLAVPSGDTLELDPGGSHLMMEGIDKQLTAGENVELTLHFEHSNDISVTVPVLPLEELAERIEN